MTSQYKLSHPDSIHLHEIGDFGNNQLNKNNTFRDLGLTTVLHAGYKFGIGIFSTKNQNTGEFSPVPALLVWSPQGWITLALSFPFWDSTPGDGKFDVDIDVDVDGDEDADDLRNIMWSLEESFNPVIAQFIADNPDPSAPTNTTTVTVFDNDWEKIDALIKTARIENGKLKFNWSL